MSYRGRSMKIYTSTLILPLSCWDCSLIQSSPLGSFALLVSFHLYLHLSILSSHHTYLCLNHSRATLLAFSHPSSCKIHYLFQRTALHIRLYHGETALLISSPVCSYRQYDQMVLLSSLILLTFVYY